MGDTMEDNDPVGSLIRRARLRDLAPETTERRVRTEVRAAWQAAVDARRRRRWRSFAAAAAVVAVALIVGGRLSLTPVVPGVAASIAHLTGQVLVNGAPFGGDMDLLAGDTLATSPTSRASLDFAEGALRMDVDTAVRFVDGKRLRLLQGRLYIDSGAGPSSVPVQIVTALGTVTDVGTQFQVTLPTDETLQVGVREGLVDVEQEDRIVSAKAGEAIQITDNGELTRTAVDSQDESWDWAEALAPRFDIENRSLLEFLKWAARETGRGLVFKDINAERSADREMLRGSIDGMNPDQALEAVRNTVQSPYQVVDDQIVVEAASN